jgi:hypothetical protein
MEEKLLYMQFLLEKRNISFSEYLLESSLTKHFNERVVDRVDNISLENFDIETIQYIKDNTSFNMNDFNKTLIDEVKNEIKLRINDLKSLKTGLNDKITIYFLSKIELKTDKIITPVFNSGDDAKLKGNIWYAIIFNDIVITLLMTNEDNLIDIIQKTKSHIKRTLPKDTTMYSIHDNTESYRLLKNDKYIKIFDVKNIKETPETLLQKGTKRISKPIKTRIDYRKGDNYIHNRYGKGVIQTVKLNRKEEDGTKVYHVVILFPDFGLKKLELKSAYAK